MKYMLSSIVGLILTAVLAGCVVKRVIWSPDGKQAIVIADEGLHLCDEQGKVSKLLLSNVVTAVWFSDSERVALLRTEKYSSWNEVARVLPPENRAEISTALQDLTARLRKNQGWEEASKAVQKARQLTDNELALLSLRFKDQARSLGLNLPQPLEGTTTAELGALQLARIKNGVIEPGPVLARDPLYIWEARIAPNEKAISYGTYIDKKISRIFVVKVEGTNAPVQVESQAAAYPDWSPDSQTLYYIRSVSPNQGEDQIRLASLSRRQVLGRQEELLGESQPEDLAGLLFSEYARVRCLKDGRVLFTAAEVHLPATTADLPQRNQLFMLDPQRQSTVTMLTPRSAEAALPSDLSFFEVSPDEKQVAIGGQQGAVAIFTLASGKVEVAQAGLEGKDFNCVPAWRRAGELCFARYAQKPGDRPEIVLWSEGKPRILSEGWPTEVRKGWLE